MRSVSNYNGADVVESLERASVQAGALSVSTDLTELAFALRATRQLLRERARRERQVSVRLEVARLVGQCSELIFRAQNAAQIPGGLPPEELIVLMNEIGDVCEEASTIAMPRAA